MWICRKTRMEWPCPRDPIKVVNVFAAVTVAKSLPPLSMSQPALVKWRFPSRGSSLGSRSRLPAIFGRRAIFFAARLLRFRRSKYLSSLASSGMGFFSLRGRRWVCCVRAMACATADDEPANIKTTHLRQKKFPKSVLYTTVGRSFQILYLNW